MNAEQRRFNRENAVMDGAFRCLDSNTQGVLIMTDRSRGGMRATLTQPVEPGKRVECGIHLPEQPLPVFTRGTVMWVRAKPRENTFGFDAGIRWDSAGGKDPVRGQEMGISSWQIGRIALFARQRGYFARRFPDTHAKSSYFLPSIWLVYIAIGGLSAMVFPSWLPIFFITLAAWGGVILIQGLRLAGKISAPRSGMFRAKALAMLCFSKPFVSLEYGIFFLRGFVSRHLPRDLR